MLTLKEQRYYNNLDSLFEKSYKAVMEAMQDFDTEYEFQHSNPDDWDLSNAQDYRNALRSDNYQIVKSGTYHSGWRVVTAINGLQAWQNKKGEFHAANKDLGWFTTCYEFNDAGGATMFRKKNIGTASGIKDNISYLVKADNTYERDESGAIEYHTDVNGNETQTNRYNTKKINHDNTYTNDYLRRDPDNRFDPNRLIRYAVDKDRKDFFRQFVTIWSRYWEQNKVAYENNTGIKYNQKGIVGYDEADEQYIFDINNASGIYQLIVKLDTGLTQGSIKYKDIDWDNWYSKYDKKQYGLYEDARYTGDYEIYDDNDDYDDEYEDEDQNKIPDGTGYILFGNDIEYSEPNNEEENNGEQSSDTNGATIITVYFTDPNSPDQSIWVINPSTNEWLNQTNNAKIGTATIENNQQQMSTIFKLQNSQGNLFMFTVNSNQLQPSQDGKNVAQNIPIYYVANNSLSSQIGTVSIEYSLPNNTPNMFAESIARKVIENLLK